METITPIKLGLAEKLREKSYRQNFFENIARDEIAMQVRALRIKRGLRQVRLMPLLPARSSLVGGTKGGSMARSSPNVGGAGAEDKSSSS